MNNNKLLHSLSIPHQSPVEKNRATVTEGLDEPQQEQIAHHVPNL